MRLRPRSLRLLSDGRWSVRLRIVVASVGLVLLFAPPGTASLLTTKHNLSSTGPGPIKAVSETQVCLFCHVPHNANPAVPLWGHALSSASYTVYVSDTLQGSAGQPTGSSKLCLSCHDGAVAVGAVLASGSCPSGSIAMYGVDAAGFIPNGPSNLGTNLSDDHPVSLTPATGAQADPEIVVNLPADAKVKYDANGQVQCTSCHDPHDDSNGKFLVAPDVAAGYGSQLCLACHAKFNWGASAHRNADHQRAATAIKAQACAACHQVHAAPIPEHLLRGGEEGLCNSCHNGSAEVSPALKNVAATFALPYAHPTATVSGKHSGAETFTDTNDPAKRHAECADCHNPHSVQAGTHAAGSSKIGAVLLGAWGMKPIYGSTPWTDPIGWQKVVFTDTVGPDMLEAYLCFKCHKNLAKAFNPNNPSYHAVVGDSKADPAYDGSYINGWSAASRMTCTDCHTSSNQTIKGPHGSNYSQNIHRVLNSSAVTTDPVLLFADYLRGGGQGEPLGTHYTTEGTGGSYAPNPDGTQYTRNTDNDLCFKCHNGRVYGHPYDSAYRYGVSLSGFRCFAAGYNTENQHLNSRHRKACTTCHVVHGSNKPHLLAYVSDDFNLNAHFHPNYLAEGGQWSYAACHGGGGPGC